MQKPIQLLSLGLIITFFLSLSCSVISLYVIDDSRIGHRFTTNIPDNPNQNIVYRIWEPLNLDDGVNRGNHVAILMHGFSSTQSFMYPLMRILTKLGYWVITFDFRGHGESGGIYRGDREQQLQDFDIVLTNAQSKSEYAELDWTNITIVGHSMGGGAATWIGNQRSSVFITIGVAPAAIANNVNTTHPGNFLVVAGGKDQSFSPELLLIGFHQSSPGAEFGIMYGTATLNSARKIVVVPNARHESELADNDCLTQIVSFIEYCYGYRDANDLLEVNLTLQSTIMYLGVLFGIIAVIFGGILLSLTLIKEPSTTQIVKVMNPQASTEITSNSKTTSSRFRVEMWWWVMLIPGTVIAGLAFILGIVVIPAGFANMQTLLTGIGGCTSLCLLLTLFYKQTKTDPQQFSKPGTRLKQLFRISFQNLNLRAIIAALLLYGELIFLLNIGLGEYYLNLFPWNSRALYVWYLFPTNFLFWLFQGWILFSYYQERNPSFPKAFITIMLLKYLIPFGLCGILLLTGNMLITFFILLYLIDILGTIIIAIGYRISKQYISLVFWVALTTSFIYLGYGAFMLGNPVMLGPHG